jgi:hypothetical protein
MGKHRHTNERRGSRVIVTMQDGSQFQDVFVARPAHRRWVEFRELGRVPMSQVKSVARMVGREIK